MVFWKLLCPSQKTFLPESKHFEKGAGKEIDIVTYALSIKVPES